MPSLSTDGEVALTDADGTVYGSLACDMRCYYTLTLTKAGEDLAVIDTDGMELLAGSHSTTVFTKNGSAIGHFSVNTGKVTLSADGKDTIQGAAKNDILYLYNINNIKTQAKFKMSGKNLVMNFTTNKNDTITLTNWTTSGLNKFVVGGKTYSLKKSGSKVTVK